MKENIRVKLNRDTEMLFSCLSKLFKVLDREATALKAGFQLREILRCRKFSLSFFSIVSDHAELMFKIQKKPCEIFRQRNISRNWKPTFSENRFDKNSL